MVEEINRLRKANESLGGTFEVLAFGLVPGLGSHISWEDRLDGRLAGAVASIQSIKGVAIGEAWDVAGRPGSEAHDEIFWSEKRGYFRETNRAGGLEGGMTNGQPLSVRAAIKPISTLTKPLRSVDTETKQPAQALRERTDSTVVPAAAVVAEAMVCLTLARGYREKFGGDHIDDVRAAIDAYKQRIDFRGLRPVSEAGDRLHRLHGGRQVDRARGRARGRAGDDRDRRADGSGARRPIAEAFEEHGEEAFREREAGGRRRAAGAAPTAARSRSAAAASSPSGCARRSAATPSSGCEIDAAEAWRRIAGTTAAGDQRSRRRARCWPTRQPLYEELADAVVPWPTAGVVARALPAIQALAELPDGTRLLWASSASGDYPVFVGRGLLETGWWPLEGRRFCVTDASSARSTRTARAARRPASRSTPGERRKTLAQARASARASWPQTG